MKSFSKLVMCSIALTWLMLSHVFGQSPEAFKYQAVVRDANYVPITGTAVKIRISILEGSDSGPNVYQEVHAVTTSSIGLVSLNIGKGTVTNGTFSNVKWESYDHFLQVELDQYGGTNYLPLGSSQLLSVPYALHATTVENVDDADADPTNELQDLSLTGNELSISDGNSVTLPSLEAGEGISIDSNLISNIKPSLWQLKDSIVFVDSNLVAIGITDSSDFPADAHLFVNGNVRVAEDSALLGVGKIVGSNGIDIVGRSNGSNAVSIQSSGRVTFEEEVGINQVFSFVDFNIRNQAGNSTVFQVENENGRDLFEVSRTGNAGFNRISNNVTLQVRNRDTSSLVPSNNIIANFERANGDNVLQIQDDKDVVVTGDFSVSGSKNFILDHPLDPANKTLTHNAVESPDHVTYYHGTVQLDASGSAVVSLPNYFEALNTDFHYQLTCIGAFAQVYISQEIQNNKFSIGGGSPGMKVSWQVSAKRDDPWAHDHPYQAEEEKEPNEIGKYYYPEGYGKGRAFKIGSGEVNGEER